MKKMSFTFSLQCELCAVHTANALMHKQVRGDFLNNGVVLSTEPSATRTEPCDSLCNFVQALIILGDLQVCETSKLSSIFFERVDWSQNVHVELFSIVMISSLK